MTYIKSILPSWRFAHAEAMKAESEQFFRYVDAFPMFTELKHSRDQALSILEIFDKKFPLISTIDAKCDGCVRRAIIHMGETNDYTRQPGYRYLIGGLFDKIPTKGEVEYFIRAVDQFVNYRPPVRRKR